MKPGCTERPLVDNKNEVKAFENAQDLARRFVVFDDVGRLQIIPAR
jgi:hypothetical protein